MDAKDYQEQAGRTLIDVPDFQITDEQVMLVWNATGLAGEAGEVVEHIKKGVFHQKGIDREHLKKELGDVLWYVAALCTKLGLSMDEVMEHNIEKLKARFPNGWDATDSVKRADEEGVPLSDEDWRAASMHFQSIRNAYHELRGTPGVNVMPALKMVFEPLSKRYASGERTRELYDEMMGVE